jgi:hypothetical protein
VKYNEVSLNILSESNDNYAAMDIFGAETNTIGAENDKFCAETNEFIFYK